MTPESSKEPGQDASDGIDSQQTATTAARERAIQVFGFLKAFAEKGLPQVLHMDKHEWYLRIAALPDHPSIQVGTVELDMEAPADAQQTPASRPLIAVTRATPTAPPEPPAEVRQRLRAGWDDLKTLRPELLQPEAPAEGTEAESPSVEDLVLQEAFDAWCERWVTWASTERPVRESIRVFESLYSIRARLEREGEHLELLVANGSLLWNSPKLGRIDHPLLLQRIEMQFDGSGPTINIIESDLAPELYPQALSLDGLNVDANGILKLQKDVLARGYHPLEQTATHRFLSNLATELSAQGTFHPQRDGLSASSDPKVVSDPVILLRKRGTGFPKAIEGAIQGMKNGAEIPPSLRRLVGIETPELPGAIRSGSHSPWSQPEEIYLSKPANAEQVSIAEVLSRFGCVLVQGPPGTGKTHTIANLIGDLLAKGKRVLVTSQTTKALRVLREKVDENLRSLCVSVLDNDTQSRAQMEEAINAILSRLSNSEERELQAEVERQGRSRRQLLQQIQRTTEELQELRQGEYRPITFGTETITPADAARWIQEEGAAYNWIPGRVEAGAPLPASESDINWLYASNTEVNQEEEAAITLGLPSRELLISVSQFEELCGALYTSQTDDSGQWFENLLREEDIDSLERAAAELTGLVSDFQSRPEWLKSVIAIGHAKDPQKEIWQALCQQSRAYITLAKASATEISRHGPQSQLTHVDAEDLRTASEMCRHLQNGGRLSFASLLLRPRWRRILNGITVNGARVKTAEEMQASTAYLEIQASARDLALQWDRVVPPAGLPVFASVGEPQVLLLEQYLEAIETALGWWEASWGKIATIAADTALRLDDLRAREAAREIRSPFASDWALVSDRLVEMFTGRLGRARKMRAQRMLAEMRDGLASGASVLHRALRQAVEGADPVAYANAFTRTESLRPKEPVVARRAEILKHLAASAPVWAEQIRGRSAAHGLAQPPSDVSPAWRFSQCSQELDARAAKEEANLKETLDRLKETLTRTTVAYISARAYLAQKERLTLESQQALQGWVQTQRRIGRGTGKRVPALQAQARKLLEQARDAVPVWIMPLARVAESFNPTQQQFDVVIVDEASQSDCLGLFAWYLGKAAVIVGDEQQVSPLAIGESIEAASNLRNQFLADIPNHHLFDGKLSIYDLAGQCFSGTIQLKEHFRCVPEIIEFSNHLSYDGKIRPLRDGTNIQRPHVAEVIADTRVGTLRGEGKTNLAEARWVAALLKAAIDHPAYKHATFGAITLLGDEQAHLIYELALDRVGAVDLDARRFVAGNSAQFQGDERTVMFLSMVDSPGERRLSMRNDPPTKQRYNVAASRAQDQLWLIHSLNPNQDLQADDLRRRLIEHVRDPLAIQREISAREAMTESPFEREVLRHLVGAGFAVEPQVWVGRYRLDFVIRYQDKQVAFECDGDRYHGLEKIPDDLARQAVLERAGWRFVRVRGTQFYRDRERTMSRAVAELNELGIYSSERQVISGEATAVDRQLQNEVMAGAWAVMRDAGWLTEKLAIAGFEQ